MGSTELQLAARVDGITQADVREALWERRELVKSGPALDAPHPPGGRDRLWTAARRAASPPPTRERRARERRRDRCRDRRALRGRQLTREELADAVVGRVRRRLGSGSPRLGLLPRRRCHRRAALFRPTTGERVTFVHPDDWLGRRRRAWKPQRSAARGGAEVCGGVRPGHAPRVPAVVGSRKQWFEELDFPGPMRAPQETQSVRLLPEYDVYVMGYRDRDSFVPPSVRADQGARQGPLRGAGRDAVPARGRRLRRDLAPSEDRETDRADRGAGAKANPGRACRGRCRGGANRRVPRARAAAQRRAPKRAVAWSASSRIVSLRCGRSPRRRPTRIPATPVPAPRRCRPASPSLAAMEEHARDARQPPRVAPAAPPPPARRRARSSACRCGRTRARRRAAGRCRHPVMPFDSSEITASSHAIQSGPPARGRRVRALEQPRVRGDEIAVPVGLRHAAPEPVPSAGKKRPTPR